MDDLNQLTYVIWVCSIGKQVQQLQISRICSFCKLRRKKRKQFTDRAVYPSLQHSSRGQVITGHSSILFYCLVPEIPPNSDSLGINKVIKGPYLNFLSQVYTLYTLSSLLKELLLSQKCAYMHTKQ